MRMVFLRTSSQVSEGERCFWFARPRCFSFARTHNLLSFVQTWKVTLLSHIKHSCLLTPSVLCCKKIQDAPNIQLQNRHGQQAAFVYALLCQLIGLCFCSCGSFDSPNRSCFCWPFSLSFPTDRGGALLTKEAKVEPELRRAASHSDEEELF